VTEAEWLACGNPVPMLGFLQGKSSDRKLHLLACACCRRAWALLETDNLRQGVEVFERFADGEADEEGIHAAALATHPLRNYYEEIWSGDPRHAVMMAAYAVNAAMSGYGTSGESKWTYGLLKAVEFLSCAARPDEEAEQVAQSELIREIIGNPFRPVVIDPVWLAWADGTVAKLARVIYDERAFDRLPILADALTDAGCGDEALLSHLRNPGVHARGCWAVDAVLGQS
jgi:hypothetical protein